MVLPPRRALAFALALLLVPVAGAQEPEVPEPEAPEQLDCQAPIEECFPDFIPTNPTVDASDERFPVKACTDFINIGTGPSAVPFRVLLRIDGVDVAEKQFNDVYEKGGGERAVCWSDIAVGLGRHTMQVVVDYRDEVFESNETNNARGASFFVRPRPQVDLAILDLAVFPKEAGVGQTQFFMVNVTNVGEATSNATTVDLLDENGEIVTWPLKALPPGERVSFVHPTRADIRPVGTFVVRAHVDPSDNVSELSEANNELIEDYTVLDHPAPDYVISSVNVTGNRTEMRGVRIDVVVENIGDRAVRGTTVRVLNETNATIAHGTTLSIIPSGGAGTVQFYLALRAGDHALRLVADPTRIVGERNESNNDWLLNLTIDAAPVSFDGPNLIVERVYAMPEDPRPGEMVSVGALVHNIGTNKSNATTVNFTIAGRHVGAAPVPALQPDAYYSAYVPWVGGDADTYAIVASVDPRDDIFELAEDDNALTREFLITTQRPPEEPTAPTPTTPTVPTTPTPTTPTPTTPEAPVPATQRIAFGELILSTRSVPGGVKGVVSVSLRNPTIQPIGALTVEFKVDGKSLVTKLVQGIAGAGSGAVTTGEVDLPAGKHTVTAELRVVGSSEPSLVRSKEYEAEAESKGLPGFEAAFLAMALVLALALRRR